MFKGGRMNDIEKAIENINDFIEVWELEQADEYMEMIISKEDIDAFKIAISALEKQIPKKANNVISRRKLQDGTYMQTGTCPLCGYDLLDSTFKFCKHCGTAIDWSVEE